MTPEGNVCVNHGVPDIPYGTIGKMSTVVDDHMIYLAGGKFNGARDGREWDIGKRCILFFYVVESAGTISPLGFLQLVSQRCNIL